MHGMARVSVPAACAPDPAHTALAQLLVCAGLPASTVPLQPVTAHDPLLPCGSRITAAATAVHQALGLVLRELQGAGGPAPPTVDPGHATAWLRSYRYFSVQGGEAASPFDPLTGFYATLDGRHVYCHCNFPHHASGFSGIYSLSLNDNGDIAFSRFDAQSLVPGCISVLQ